MVAAYRFCENEKTSFDNVLQPHVDATRQRMAAQPVVLLAQDTSEIDVTRPEQQVAGAGPLDGDSRRGALLHLMHAFTPDGTPLGTVFGTAWVREEEPVCNPCRVPSGLPFPSKRRRAIVGSLRFSRRAKKLGIVPRRS